MDEKKQGDPSAGLTPGVQAPEPDAQAYSEDPYSYQTAVNPPAQPPKPVETPKAVAVRPAGGVSRRPPTPPNPPATSDGDDEDEGMLKMSFLEHLEELRSRIIKALYGLAIAFIASLLYAGKLWDIIQEPAAEALKNLGVNPPRLVMTQPMEGFSIIWVKLPLLCSVFIASPWMLYQAWSFIAPGLYTRERRWAIPGILSTAGLFITGGLFAYFLAFRYGLQFLLGIGMTNQVQPLVTITEYFDLFVDVTLGVGLVFEMPVLIIFLTMVRLASPRFLVRHSRYAILAITIIAAVVTPTPDIFNMMLFAVPMTLLYFVGVFVGYLIVLRREGKAFPWKLVALVVLGIVGAAAIVIAVLIYRFGFKPLPHWPFLSR
ncbi:MAG: twin-arginine translocase subunit TatC [Acidobacteriaceae bacterium]|nr:twin-arginine translocase subunit TatC [Acidobacteriaceae bacterium]